MFMREEMIGSRGRRKVGRGEGFPGHFQKFCPLGKGLRDWPAGVDVGHLEASRPECDSAWLLTSCVVLGKSTDPSVPLFP